MFEYRSLLKVTCKIVAVVKCSVSSSWPRNNRCMYICMHVCDQVSVVFSGKTSLQAAPLSNARERRRAKRFGGKESGEEVPLRAARSCSNVSLLAG